MTVPAGLRVIWDRALVWYNGYGERDRRVILGILIAAGLSLVYVAVVEPVLDYRKSIGKEIADGQEELERSMRFVGAKDTLRAEREDLRKRLTQAKGRLLPGGTGTLGAAALQERANALAAEKGIAVQSTQVMKEEVSEPFRKVAVRLTLSGELKALADFVAGVEYGQQLTIPFIEVSRRGAVAGAKGPRTLSATVEVSGFVQGGGNAKGEPAEGEAASPVDGLAEGQPIEGMPTMPLPGAAPEGAAPGDGPADPPVATGSTIVPVTFPPMVIPPPTVPPSAAPPGAPSPPPLPPRGSVPAGGGRVEGPE